MATLTVGPGQQYATIAAAVAASNSGDTVLVSAGTYTNDFVTITHNLSLQSSGGTVTMVATVQPPNGKAIIDEGGTGVSVSITGFDISGATVADGNGAAIRYEAGNLTLENDTIHGNQDGLLTAPDPNGTILIDDCNIYGNGAGDGYTHNIYVGQIASLTVENSSITGAIVGHEIKSRALSNTIENNTIGDGTNGDASYEIDLPDAGNATITGNYIDKGANAQNPNAISYGEEAQPYSSNSLTISNNTIVNNDTSHPTTILVNDTDNVATISNNQIYGWTNIASGPAVATNNTTLTSEPPAPACYVNGTHIALQNSEKPVEQLRIGDLVRTHAGALRPIRWIGHRAYAGRFLAAHPTLWPIRFHPGALGDGLPRRDLLVSPRHAMFLEGTLVEAVHLLNGHSITQVGDLREVHYVHIELQTHDVILAEGAPAETFLDDDSRSIFHNAREYARLYPAPHEAGRFYAPRLRPGPHLAALRHRLALMNARRQVA